MKKIGLVINPLAGIGGTVGLKGSDGENIQKLALERGAKPQSGQKAAIALKELASLKDEVMFFAPHGSMGEDILKSLGMNYAAVGEVFDSQPTYRHTENAVTLMNEAGVDLLVFAGGDGTARNVLNSCKDDMVVIGIPTGVKIHSAVFGNTPELAGRAICNYIKTGGNVKQCEVMDIDENLYRNGIVSPKLYGYLNVPSIKRLMQNPKAAQKKHADDVSGIYYELCDRMNQPENADKYYIFGTGSTVFNVMKLFGYDGSLLGVDIVYHGKVILKDATEEQILTTIVGKQSQIIVTVIGGQGHIFGRGNQQFSPSVIRSVGLNNIWIVACASKIHFLPTHCLFVDTGDSLLNSELSGYKRVIVGYQESILCNVM